MGAAGSATAVAGTGWKGWEKGWGQDCKGKGKGKAKGQEKGGEKGWPKPAPKEKKPLLQLIQQWAVGL